MSRCLRLASMGIGHVAPNPMVGAVLVHGDRVIGEGYHRLFGGPHAEVECLDSVREEDRHLIPDSRMYVSLEPCSHHGKTPPCAERILREGIREVHVACRDPFPQVDGRGIDRLRAAGVKVEEGTLAEQAMELNRRFFTCQLRGRPYVVLKWAESADGMMAGPNKTRMAISGPFANRLVHRWRTEEQAILVGAGTAVIDDPLLTSRIPGGRNPLRIVLSPNLNIHDELSMFSQDAETVVINSLLEDERFGVTLLRLDDSGDVLADTLKRLDGMNVQSVLVEGGRITLESFLDSGVWDECRRIQSLALRIPGGYPAPSAPRGTPVETLYLESDRIDFFRNPASISAYRKPD